MSKKGSGDGCGKANGPKGGKGYMGLLEPFGEEVTDRRPGVIGVLRRVFGGLSSLPNSRDSRA